MEIYGWDASTGNILTISYTENNPKKFITEYGCLTHTGLVLNAAAFVGISNIKSQNNHTMVECMLDPLTKHASAKYQMNMRNILFKI